MSGSHLFQLGAFTLHSGHRSPYKVECEALTDTDWQALAWMAVQASGVHPFSAVEGVPRGGLRFAEALRGYRTPDATGLLVVDDVLTTGAAMEAQRAGRAAQGLVVFARGPCPSWVQALWRWGL